tara:strand:+ start:176 stop:973 length:798 start_codon:yes stop_codon:yes gene_type:complete
MAKKIEKDWPKYKCQPGIIPLAGFFGKDTLQNFTECIGDIQGGFMDLFLGPLKTMMKSLGDIGNGIMNSINSLRQMFKFLTDALIKIFGRIFGLINNIIISFQKIVNSLKDLLMKLVGVFYTLLMMIRGMIFFSESVIAGPLGSFIDVICFSPNTKIKLSSGQYKIMKDICLGEILEDGSEVKAVLRIKGNSDTPYYKIYSKKLNEYIYVTGSHLIMDPKTNKFIKVETFENAEICEEWGEELSCLITSTNKIPIGEYTFWDWED